MGLMRPKLLEKLLQDWGLEHLSKIDTGVSKEAGIYNCGSYALHNPVGTIDIVGMRALYFFSIAIF